MFFTFVWYERLPNLFLDRIEDLSRHLQLEPNLNDLDRNCKLISLMPKGIHFLIFVFHPVFVSLFFKLHRISTNKTLHLKSLAQKTNQTRGKKDPTFSHGSRLRPSQHPRCHRDRPNHGRHGVRRGTKRHCSAAGCGGTGCGGCGGCGHASWAAKCQGAPRAKREQLGGFIFRWCFPICFFSLHLYFEEIIPFFSKHVFFIILMG